MTQPLCSIARRGICISADVTPPSTLQPRKQPIPEPRPRLQRRHEHVLRHRVCAQKALTYMNLPSPSAPRPSSDGTPRADVKWASLPPPVGVALDSTFALADARKAHERAARGHVRGKIVLMVR